MSVRTRRRLLRGVAFAFGLGLIVGGVLLPVALRFQILAVVLGLLIYQTMLLRILDRFLPNEREYLALRDETEQLLELVRDLNQAAVAARALGINRDQYLNPIVRRLHEAVDRLPQVAAARSGEGRYESAPAAEARLQPTPVDPGPPRPLH